MKQVGQPPHHLARLECSDGRPWREIRHPVLMTVPSMRVLSLVRQVRGFLCVLLGTPARGCQDFMFQVGKLRLLGSVGP